MASDELLAGLMSRYQQGDGAAVSELYRQVSPGMLNYLWRFTQDRGLAEDLVQETFLRVHKVRQTYRPGSPVRPWLFAIARYAAIDALRKKGRRRELVYDELPVIDALVTQPEEPRDPSGTERVEKALQALPQKQREALLLTKAGGLSMREAAAALGTTEGAVKVRVHRALVSLRRSLGHDPETTEDSNGTG